MICPALCAAFRWSVAQCIGTEVVQLDVREDGPGIKDIFLISSMHARTSLRAFDVVLGDSCAEIEYKM